MFLTLFYEDKHFKVYFFKKFIRV